jgi:hypothetical protein
MGQKVVMSFRQTARTNDLLSQFHAETLSHMGQRSGSTLHLFGKAGIALVNRSLNFID